MRVLVACEYSGIVRDAFTAKGHDAISCDYLPTERPGKHYQGDVMNIINDGFDLMIAFPPCTHLAVSGAAWFEQKRKDGRQQQGIDFFLALTQTNIPKWAIENPVGIMSTHYRKPDCIIQPYEFGEPVKKTTCLWLHNLPPLLSTQIVTPEITTLKTGAKFSTWDYKISMNHKERAKLRSKTFQGIAEQMAAQWG
jgi:site-specific DNA-cytosine methylase